ncbi:hypothetical protein [Bacillus anthracis]|uniref:hypothetical protein n=1 Tax=Bacillus anthracis TaxID=1392 RepID=UPI003BA25E6A
MDWIKFGTLVISFFTLLLSIYSAKTLNQNKKKERRITLFLSEKRRMQNDLFKHITQMLDFGRRCFEEIDEKEKQKIKFELLNLKMLITVNLDKDNDFAEDLGGNCIEYITWCASFLEASDEKVKSNYLGASYKSQLSIWNLVNKYRENDNKLIEELM